MCARRRSEFRTESETAVERVMVRQIVKTLQSQSPSEAPHSLLYLFMIFNRISELPATSIGLQVNFQLYNTLHAVTTD